MRLIYEPSQQETMRVAFFVSGEGTTYQKAREADPTKRYVVFSNVPDCTGAERARINSELVALDSKRYFRETWGVWGRKKVPRKGVERDSFDMAAARLVEQKIGEPQLICLAGYNLWLGDWIIDRYYPIILNHHPSDTRKKYKGLHWRPIAKAVLAGETDVKATVFFVDTSEDEGPVLIQSQALLLTPYDDQLYEIRQFAAKSGITTLEEFGAASERERPELYAELQVVSSDVQHELKIVGDHHIMPFAVHELVGKGRAAMDDRKIFIDGIEMPPEGYQVDEYGFCERITRWF